MLLSDIRAYLRVFNTIDKLNQKPDVSPLTPIKMRNFIRIRERIAAVQLTSENYKELVENELKEVIVDADSQIKEFEGLYIKNPFGHTFAPLGGYIIHKDGYYTGMKESDFEMIYKALDGYERYYVNEKELNALPRHGVFPKEYVEQLTQCLRIVADGDLISKSARDYLHKNNYILCYCGYNIITVHGLQVLMDLNLLKD